VVTGRQIVDFLFFKSWWTYRSGEPDWFEIPYHLFNLFEGAVWVVLSALVLKRYLQHRRSVIELAYAFAFFSFGLTDFREAYALDSWLIWIKGINLLVLIWLRSVVIRRYYPASKLY
jgi:hypothetical protein